MEAIQDLIKNLTLIDLSEYTAVITAIAYVILAAFGKKLCFFFGFISSILYVYITWEVKLYFDLLINVFYVIMSIYGWINWTNNTNYEQVKFLRIGAKKLLLLLIGGMISSVILAYGADRFTDTSLPYLDAFTTIFSIIATWMIVRRFIENWLLWIIIDLVAIGMYWYKGLGATSFLFLFYTLFAIFGYYKWKKQMHAH